MEEFLKETLKIAEALKGASRFGGGRKLHLARDKVGKRLGCRSCHG